MSTIHEGLRPYKCEKCDKTFGVRERLKRHFETVHEGKKKYQCPLCSQKFTTRFCQNLHMSKVMAVVEFHSIGDNFW